MKARRIIAMNEWREQPRPGQAILPIDPRADRIVRWARWIDIAARWAIIFAVPALLLMVGWAILRGLIALGMLS